MTDKTQVTISSDQHHNKVVAEIHYSDKFVALVSHDGDECLIEIPGQGFDETCISRTIPVKDFQNALNIALRRLQE